MTSPVTPDPAVQTSEPVLIAQAVTVILGALVSLGWVVVPDATIDLVGTGVALVIAAVAAVVARGKVTPLAKAGALNADALRLLVAEVVRTELATLADYRASTVPPQAPSETLSLPLVRTTPGVQADTRVDWMGRDQ